MIYGYKGLSRNDIEEDTEEKGLDYFLRETRKGDLFCLLKKLNEEELDLVLKKLIEMAK